MRRMVLTETGWDAPLEPRESERPSPAEGQVLVEVEACGVCYRDLIDRSGRFPYIQLPITPGHEAAGRVIETGPQVSEWQVGDRVATMHRDFCGTCEACTGGQPSLCQGAFWVFGLMAHGGYATHLVAPERAFYPVPDGMTPETAAVLHCTFGTAFRGLVTQGHLEAGQTVLITGANGGVGAAAVVLAKRLGADIVAVVREERHSEWLRTLGADRVLVDPGAGFHKRVGSKRAHLALDCVGEPTINASIRSLRMGGRAVVIGNVIEQRASINLGYLIVNGLRLIGSSGATREDMAQVVALWQQSPFDAHIDCVRPIEDADAAQRAVKAGGLTGRIVLSPAIRHQSSRE